MSAERAKTAEEWFEDLAHQNARKNVWKMKSIEEKCRADAAEREVRLWRRATAAIAAICLVLGVALLCATGIGRRDDSKTQFINLPRDASYSPLAAEMPPHAWATGLIENGGIWCSAVTILKEDEHGFGLCCGHCFAGKLGGTFWYRRPDGKDVEATLLAHVPPAGEGKPDLALFRVRAEDVLAVAPVVLEMPKQGTIHYDVIGYPGGTGPTYHPLDQPGSYGTNMWTFHVADGKRIHKGNSGSPVFVNGLVCGILSGANTTPMGASAASIPELARRSRGPSSSSEPQIIGTHAFVTDHPTLVAFLKANRRFFKDSPFCDKNGNCTRPDDLGEAGPAPPPMKEAPPANPPGPWKPSPNLPMPPLDARGKQQADSKLPKNSCERDKLHAQATQQQFDTLNGKLDALLQQSQLAPLPQPAINLSGVHSKLDALRQGMADLEGQTGQPGPLAIPDLDRLKAGVIEGVKAELPKVLGQHLGPVEQRLQWAIASHGAPDLSKLPSDVRDALLPELPSIGKQIAGDLIPSISAVVPNLLPMLGIVGGPLGIGVGLAGWFLSRATGKNTAVLSAVVNHLARNYTDRNPPGGPGPGAPGSAPPAPVPTTTVVEKPVPVLTQAPPAPQVIMPQTNYVPVQTDQHARAWAQAKAWFSMTYPNSASTAEVLESYIQQILSGQQLKAV